jgi:uncharacterized metal-binding protein
MTETKKPGDARCADCESKTCRGGADCFGTAPEDASRYAEPDLARLYRAAAAVEARHYGKETRIGELIRFAAELGVRKLGLAFCIGLEEEARMLADVLGRHFEVVSVCCKVGGIPKQRLRLEQLDPARRVEVSCNPVGQAAILARAGTELNVLCGLCVGHDALFCKASRAPVTTVIAKDRVLGHNPAAALWCRYVRKGLPKP